MAGKPVQYWVIDAFTDSPFKGNPAAVCLVEEERGAEWMQLVARECNFPVTSFLRRAHPLENGNRNTRFHLRWFAPVAEVKICGHGTLAAAHFLFTCGLSATNTIEFITKFGLLTTKKVELPSAKAVADLKPQSQLDEIRECPGKGVMVTGLAPRGSGFDFFTHFCPKLGVNEASLEETRMHVRKVKRDYKRI